MPRSPGEIAPSRNFRSSRIAKLRRPGARSDWSRNTAQVTGLRSGSSGGACDAASASTGRGSSFPSTIREKLVISTRLPSSYSSKSFVVSPGIGLPFASVTTTSTLTTRTSIDSTKGLVSWAAAAETRRAKRRSEREERTTAASMIARNGRSPLRAASRCHTMLTGSEVGSYSNGTVTTDRTPPN